MWFPPVRPYPTRFEVLIHALAVIHKFKKWEEQVCSASSLLCRVSVPGHGKRCIGKESKEVEDKSKWSIRIRKNRR